MHPGKSARQLQSLSDTQYLSWHVSAEYRVLN